MDGHVIVQFDPEDSTECVRHIGVFSTPEMGEFFARRYLKLIGYEPETLARSESLDGNGNVTSIRIQPNGEWLGCHILPARVDEWQWA